MTAIVWMLLLLLLGGFVYGAVIFICSRWENGRYRKLGGLPLRAYKYRAVELKLCSNHCEAALGIAGKRILKSEAPSLPLAECNRRKCTCRYIQYKDRRYMQRRDSSTPGALPGKPSRDGDRRRAGGRRASDKS